MLTRSVFLPISVIIRSVIGEAFRVLVFLRNFVIGGGLLSYATNVQAKPNGTEGFFVVIKGYGFRNFYYFLVVSFLLPSDHLALRSRCLW